MSQISLGGRAASIAAALRAVILLDTSHTPVSTQSAPHDLINQIIQIPVPGYSGPAIQAVTEYLTYAARYHGHEFIIGETAHIPHYDVPDNLAQEVLLAAFFLGC